MRECRPSRAIVIIAESRPAKLCFQPARTRVERRDICALPGKADHPRQVCLPGEESRPARHGASTKGLSNLRKTSPCFWHVGKVLSPAKPDYRAQLDAMIASP